MKSILGFVAVLAFFGSLQAVFAGTIWLLGTLCRPCLDWQPAAILIGAIGVATALFVGWLVIEKLPRIVARGRG